MWSISMVRQVFVLSCLLLLLAAGCAPEEERVAPETGVPAAAGATPATASPEARATSSEAAAVELAAAATAAVTGMPAVEATAASTPEVEPAQILTGGGFCPQVTRPALILKVSFEEYVVTNLLTGETCPLPFPEHPLGLQVTADALYYRAQEGGKLVVQRLAPDGTVEALPYAADAQGFVVSEDGNMIAWSSAWEDPADEESLVSELWVADIGTGEAKLLTSNVSAGVRHYLMPVRFSPTAETLVYTLRPDGLGGAWNTFTGRYDNLYTITVAGGESTPAYDCAADDLFYCIGDFILSGDEPPTLATVDAKTGTVLVRNGAQVMNTLSVAADYIGYPTFSPAGELIFYSANLAEDGIFPEEGNIYRVAPLTATAEVVISDPQILSPNRFLDGSHLFVGFLLGVEQLGSAVVNIHEGALLPLESPYTRAMAVIPAEAPAEPLQVLPTSTSSPCVNDSEFVLDVTVPDGTHFAPGAAFTKTWRLRNSGTCTWDASYRLHFISGERMDGAEHMEIGRVVLPGGEVDISVALIAPQAEGSYRGQWQLAAPDRGAFGAKPYVEIVIP